MAYVVIITMLALLQYLYFAVRVRGARGRFNIPAPAIEHLRTIGDLFTGTLGRGHGG